MIDGARPRGIVARMRHQAGPLLPAFLRRAGARLLGAVEARRGAVYEIAGQRIRFLSGAAPTVMAPSSDGRDALDALQLSRFADAIRPGDCVADVGAYRGTYAVVAAAIAGPHGRVFAFEPTASNAAIIGAHARLNDFESRIVIEQAAVSDATGSATFYAWGDATTNSLASQATEAATVQVRTIALDEYFAQHKPPRVLKIDIEGAELLALRGARRILASDACIICELHPYAWPDFGYTAADLRTLLEQYNRFTADLATGEELTEYRYGAVLLAKRD